MSVTGPPAGGTSTDSAAPVGTSSGSTLDREFIERLLDRVEKAHRTFRAELLIYRAGSVAAMALLIIAAVRTLVFKTPSPVDLGTFLGAGGLFAITGDRTTRFLRENLQLLGRVIDRVLELGGRNG